MNEADMRAEQDLVADLLCTANDVEAGLWTGESASVWQQRREEIAALRRRIDALRAAHLGTLPPLSRWNRQAR